MGNRASSSKYHDALTYSAATERQIEEVPMIFRKECKILLLGKSLSFTHGLRSEHGFGRSATPLICIGVHSFPTHNSVTLFGFISPRFAKASKYRAFSGPFSAATRDVNSPSVRHLVVRYDRTDLGPVSLGERPLGRIHCLR